MSFYLLFVSSWDIEMFLKIFKENLWWLSCTTHNKGEWKDNCVQERIGAWWYKRCFVSSLNDVYYQNTKILPAPPPDHGMMENLENLERRHLNTHWKRTSSKFPHQIYINIYITHLSQDNKSNHKINKKNNKKITVVICTKGARFVCCEILIGIPITQLINYTSIKFLLQIHIVNSFCKCLSYVPITNFCNCNASLVNGAQ